jgi:hypothetical protein
MGNSTRASAPPSAGFSSVMRPPLRSTAAQASSRPMPAPPWWAGIGWRPALAQNLGGESRSMVPYRQAKPGRIPVKPHHDRASGSIRRIVEQIADRLFQRGIEGQPRHRTVPGYREGGTGLRPHRLPARHHSAQPVEGILRVQRFGSRRAAALRHAADDALAERDLLAHQGQVGAHIRIQPGVALQFANQHRDRRQRRAQFMRGARRHAAQGHHSLVAQGLLARSREMPVTLADRRRHARDEPGDHCRGNHEGQPHSGQVKACRTLDIAHRQRQVQPGQQRIDRHREHRYGSGQPAWQRQCRHRDRDQQQGYQRIRRATGKIEQHRQRHQVDTELAEQLTSAHRLAPG